MIRFFLVIYLLSTATLSFAQQKDSLYAKGVEALSKKDYKSAEKYFTQNIEISKSYEGFYNLGFAFAKQEKWNESLWANEAALKYKPTNSKAIYNAKFSLEKVSSDAEWTHPYTWTKRIILSIGQTTWLVLMVVSSLIVALSVYLLIVHKKSNIISSWPLRLIIIFLLILITSIICFNDTMNHFEENRYAYSKEVETTLYLSPEGLEVDENLPVNIRLNVVIDQDEWLQVLTPEFNSYWVKKEDVYTY